MLENSFRKMVELGSYILSLDILTGLAPLGHQHQAFLPLEALLHLFPHLSKLPLQQPVLDMGHSLVCIIFQCQLVFPGGESDSICCIIRKHSVAPGSTFQNSQQ